MAGKRKDPFLYVGMALWIAAAFGISGCAHCRQITGTHVSASSDPHSLIDFYQGPLNHLSAVRRGQCPMYPACSEYCRRAFEKHGFVMGWLMSVDRLLRCGRDEMDSACEVYDHGSWKAYDPIENNDFWWTKSP
jgi:putative component of membrane protein insertase Oxa1/YidC/SpoIIIJ protein YidD